MTTPTLSGDLDEVERWAEPMPDGTVMAAINRLRAAIEEREHLLEAARLLRYVIDCAQADVDPGELDMQRAQAWLESERARKAKGT